MKPYSIIPEFEVLDAVNMALNFVRKDFTDNAATPENSYLSKLFNGTGLVRYNLLQQAEAVFMTENDNPRYLEAHLMFNMEKVGAPTIHIMLPSENLQSGGNTIGVSEGMYYEEDFAETGDDPLSTTSYNNPLTRRYQTNYSIVVTSDNSNEVILIYHTLRSLLTSMQVHLSLVGLENLVLGGQDITNLQGVVPQLYMRAISMNFQYSTTVPDINNKKIFQDLVIGSGKPQSTEP